MTQMMNKTLVLDLSKWRCGDEDTNNNIENYLGYGETVLLNKQGYMCCLGQFACQLGVKKRQLLNIADPGTLENPVPLLSKINKDSELFDLINNNTKFSDNAIKINDDPNTTIEEKIRKLKSLCSKYKYKLTIKGKLKNSKRSRKA